MLKILAVLAVLLAVAQAIVPTTGQTSDSRRSDAQKQENGGEGSKKPPPRASDVPVQDTNGAGQKQTSEERSPDDQQATINVTELAPVPEPWSWHDKWLWVANIALALVGISGIVVGVCTLIILNRQTSHMVTSERAWIICKIDNLGIPNVAEPFAAETSFQFENVGKTPGFILEYGWRIIDLPSSETLPETPPDYREEGCDFAVYDRLPISPGGSITRNGQAVSENPRVLHIGSRTVWAHGYIRYCDSFSNTVHETRTCFKWLPNRANSGLFEFSIDGPSGYNRST